MISSAICAASISTMNIVRPNTTFSTPLNLKAGWYLRRGIEDCRMVEIPPEALAAKKEESHPDVERLSLFDEEGEKE